MPVPVPRADARAAAGAQQDPLGADHSADAKVFFRPRRAGVAVRAVRPGSAQLQQADRILLEDERAHFRLDRELLEVG